MCVNHCQLLGVAGRGCVTFRGPASDRAASTEALSEPAKNRSASGKFGTSRYTVASLQSRASHALSGSEAATFLCMWKEPPITCRLRMRHRLSTADRSATEETVGVSGTGLVVRSFSLGLPTRRGAAALVAREEVWCSGCCNLRRFRRGRRVRASRRCGRTICGREFPKNCFVAASPCESGRAKLCAGSSG